MYQFDSLGILKRAFGYGKELAIRKIAYRLADAEVPSRAEANPYTVETIELATSDVMSILGTPVMSPIRIKGGRYRERLPDGSINFVDYPTYDMPHTTIIEVGVSNIIEKTRVAGRRGSTKEYISQDDFVVNFRGLIVNQVDDTPPAQQIRDWAAIIKVPAALEVECEFLEWLGITNLVVEDPRIFQLEGFSHVVGFSMRCISDQVTEVRLRDGI